MAGRELRKWRHPSRVHLAHRVALALAASSALAAAAGWSPAAAVSATKPIQAIKLRLPANAGPTSSGYLYGVGCAKAGTCTAGGSYIDASNSTEAMVVAESGGRWAKAVELLLPRNAEVNPFAEVNSVACPSAGSCVAIGYYNGDTRFQGYAASQSRGRWQRARLIAPPSNSPKLSDFQLNGVTCTGVGSCVTIGGYQDKSGGFEPLAATESNGKWATARELPLPADAATLNPDAFFLSVACTRPGSCFAAGRYTDKSGHEQAGIVTETGGRWRTATQIRLPRGAASNPDGIVDEVTCVSKGFCGAVGQYKAASGGTDSFAATMTLRGWGRAVRIGVVPSNAIPHSDSYARALACTRAAFCVEGGDYVPTVGGVSAMVAFEAHGPWRQAMEVLPPSDTITGAQSSVLEALSCTSSGYCLAVGDYLNKLGRFRPMAARVPTP